ncbi:hypothetical protein GCM10022226_39800 [Sphaerisporangium flaviroseum]|uniref:Anti-sigma factor antagonist n=1 Tax=Sphaerisporangium flaviroseum TaxID=509199 RepID=A0ABP7ICH4_9ACTN
MSPLMVTYHRLPAGTVVWVSGEVDATNSAQLEIFLAGVHPRSQEPLLLELSGLSFLDGSGLAVLLRARNRLQVAGGDLHVISPHTRVLRLLEITRLGPVMNLHPDLPCALQAVSPHTAATDFTAGPTCGLVADLTPAQLAAQNSPAAAVDVGVVLPPALT